MSPAPPTVVLAIHLPAIAERTAVVNRELLDFLTGRNG